MILYKFMQYVYNIHRVLKRCCCFYCCFFNYDHPILIFQDYPSVGQIIQKAKENNINIIFVIGGNSSALTNEKVRQLFYDKLATLLPGGTEKASELSTDANNILQIVSENYRVSINELNFIFN